MLNERQKIAIDRVLRDGPDSFPFGLNAEKYIRITGTFRATATRDLQELVEKGVLKRSGELKSTRYKFDFIKQGLKENFQCVLIFNSVRHDIL